MKEKRRRIIQKEIKENKTQMYKKFKRSQIVIQKYLFLNNCEIDIVQENSRLQNQLRLSYSQFNRPEKTQNILYRQQAFYINYLKTVILITLIMKVQEHLETQKTTFESESSLDRQISKTPLQTLTEQIYFQLSNQSLYRLLAMTIDELYQFKQGIAKFYPKEKILYQMLNQFISKKLATLKEDKEFFENKSEGEKNKLKAEYEKIHNKFIRKNLSIFILRQFDMRELQLFRAGLRAYTNESDLFLINFVQRMIDFKTVSLYYYQYNSENILNSDLKYLGSFPYWANKKIQDFIKCPFNINDLKYLQFVKLKVWFERQDKSNQQFMLNILKKKIFEIQQFNYITPISKQSAQNMVKIDIKKVFMHLLQKNGDLIQSWSLEKLKLCKDSLEKDLDKEITLITVVKNRILYLEKQIKDNQARENKKKDIQARGIDKNSFFFSIQNKIRGFCEGISYKKEEFQKKKLLEKKVQECEYLIKEDNEESSKKL